MDLAASTSAGFLMSATIWLKPSSSPELGDLPPFLASGPVCSAGLSSGGFLATDTPLSRSCLRSLELGFSSEGGGGVRRGR